MRPDFVADIGNTRIKWAACEGPHLAGPLMSVPDDEAAWEAAALPPSSWVIASVRPERSQRFQSWLEARGHRVELLRSVPRSRLHVAVEHPEKVGIDRLLNAVAAKPRIAVDAVIIDAGSAVTVDYLDEYGSFQGGTIFPGLDLMADALHRYTALL
ncbi:MAG: type III pantothenate kinase, partial [Gemmataceae bacterium]